MADIIELNGKYFVSFSNVKGSDYECLDIKEGDIYGPFDSEQEAKDYLHELNMDI